jgi:hypothetical protein
MPSESNGVRHVAVSAITRAVGETLRLASCGARARAGSFFEAENIAFLDPYSQKDRLSPMTSPGLF